MYLPDLAPYPFMELEQRFDDPLGFEEPRVEILAVGWLSPSHAVRTGLAPRGFAACLLHLCRKPVNRKKGYHSCEFCAIYENIQKGSSVGNGEIHVTGCDGKLYVAPNLICHYVVHHGYLPPKQFIDAVMSNGKELP